MKVVALVAALFVASTMGSMDRAGLGCELCKEVVKMVEEFADYTEPELEKLLHDKVCSHTGFFQAFCDSVVKEYLPQILKELHNQANNGQVCKQLGLCDSLATMVGGFYFGRERSGTLGCGVCTSLASVVTEFADYTLPELTKLVNEQCGKLGFFEAFCKNVVQEYLPQIAQAIKDELSPAEVCGQLGLCKTLSTVVLNMKERGSITCSLCEGLVDVAKEFVDYSEPQLESLLNEQCGHLGFFESFCLSAVKEYVPEIAKYLGENFTSSQVCGEIGAC